MTFLKYVTIYYSKIQTTIEQRYTQLSKKKNPKNLLTRRGCKIQMNNQLLGNVKKKMQCCNAISRNYLVYNIESTYINNGVGFTTGTTRFAINFHLIPQSMPGRGQERLVVSNSLMNILYDSKHCIEQHRA